MFKYDGKHIKKDIKKIIKKCYKLYMPDPKGMGGKEGQTDEGRC